MLKKYFNHILFKNLLLAFGIFVLLLLIVQWSLRSYTRHGESITVPDLRGMSFEQVKSILSDKSLSWQVIDSVFDMGKPPLSIVDQNPKPKSNVKQGRTIYITINATTAPATEIPDLVGRSSLKYAKMQLESYGLKVGEPIYRPDPHLNAVIGMLINGQIVTRKTKVPKGTIVTLVLGDGLGNSRMSVPYLIGLRYDEAEFKLRGYSLNIGAVIADETVSDTAAGIIYKQNPAYSEGSTIRIGEPIDLFISKQLPADIIIDPTLYDKIDSVSEQ